jgi:hypothetical protein
VPEPKCKYTRMSHKLMSNFVTFNIRFSDKQSSAVLDNVDNDDHYGD